jgi:putative Holliday junction resolvase
MRIMGLDYGSKTVGVAISDELLITAQGIETVHREQENKLRRTYARIEELVREYGVEKIVVGYPKLLNNDIGERAKLCEEFAANVERRTGLETVLWDERLTTVEAHRVLDEAGQNYTKKAKVIDKLAAVLILQNYLDYLKNTSGK